MPKPRSDLENTLRLVPVPGKRDVYTNGERLHVPPGARGVFGGTLVAQSLWAAIKTVPPTFVPHSLHSYFLKSGNKDHQIEYEVDRLRDGKSFCSRQVKAFQQGELIFIEMISFTLAKSERKLPPQLKHTKPYPSNVKFEDHLDPKESFIKGVVDTGVMKDEVFQSFEKYFNRFVDGPTEYKFPIDFWVSLPNHPKNHKQPHELDVNFFERYRVPVRDPRFNYVALAYTSDSYILLSVMRFHNRPLHSSVFSVSLDHSIYFHKQPDFNQWTLYHIEHPKSGDSRKLMTGEMYERDSGDMVASIIQEGLVVINDEQLYKSKL